jgi:hypothetical protein
LIGLFVDVGLVDGVVSLSDATLSMPVDSVHIRKDVFDKMFLCSTPHTISLPFSFTDLRAEGTIKLNSINGINFAQFLKSIVTEDYSGTIGGHKTVTKTLITNSLTIQTTLNNYNFPEHLVTTSQKKLIISGYKNLSQMTATKVTFRKRGLEL